MQGKGVKMWDVIIVGAGITGLELGALLSHDGKNVLVLEKTGKIGGRAQLWEKNGFTADYGIHLIRYGRKSAVSQICRRLGHEVSYSGLGPSNVRDEDGAVKTFPTGPGGFLSSRMFTFFERLKALRVMISVRKEDFNSLKNMSVREWLDREGIRGGMRRYLHLVSASMMVCPFIEKTSVGEMLLNVQKVLRTGISVMYPRDGWRPLYDLFTRALEEHGEIRLNSKVDSVVIEKGTARGVTVGRDIIESKAVVVSVPCQEYFRGAAERGYGLLDAERFPGEFVKMCRDLLPTSGVSIDFGLSRTVSESTGLWYLWSPMSFGIFTSNLCPTLAPPGKQLLTWFFPTSREDMEDPQRAKGREEELDRAIMGLFPGMAGAVEWRRAMHLRVVDGAQINTNQCRERRPAAGAPGVRGLYFVGDSTGAAGAGGDVGHESVLECYTAMRS